MFFAVARRREHQVGGDSRPRGSRAHPLHDAVEPEQDGEDRDVRGGRRGQREGLPTRRRRDTAAGIKRLVDLSHQQSIYG